MFNYRNFNSVLFNYKLLSFCILLNLVPITIPGLMNQYGVYAKMFCSQLTLFSDSDLSHYICCHVSLFFVLTFMFSSSNGFSALSEFGKKKKLLSIIFLQQLQ